jgi:hypothetical protein
MTNTTGEAVDRRRFLAGATSVVASMAISGTAILHVDEAWGLDAKTFSAETMRTLIRMARDIFPHDRIADRYYAVACKTYDEKAGSDATLKTMIEQGLATFDAAARAAHGAPYATVPWEVQRVALLRADQTNPVFMRLRGDLVVSLYNQEEIWPLFGYEGESASKGGYIDRGFADIAWL